MSETRERPAAKPASTDEWRDIARVPNLYYHVLSWPEKEDSGWEADEFYATGVSDWDDFSGHWRHYSPRLGGTCVEIGCGVGRLTCALAEDFDTVVALDVSPDMIDRARERAPADKVEFEVVDGCEIPRPDASVDAVFSVIVLQHLESFAVVEGYLREAFRALRPGGSVMLNITITRQPRGRLERLRYEASLRRSRRRLKKGEVHERVRWREYPWEQVDSALRAIGFEDVQLRMFDVRSNRTPYQFWLAQRPASSA